MNTGYISSDFMEIRQHLEHGYEAAMHNKKRDMESIKRARYTHKKKVRLEFIKDVNEIDALIKDYEDKATKGANASTLSKLANQIIDRIKKNESKFGWPPAYQVDWAMNHGAKDNDFMYPMPKSDLHHSSISHASKAGMPTNLKQESSNTKRASERAKFITEVKQICAKMQTLDEQLTRLGRNNFKTYEDPVRFKDVKTGGGYTANREIANLRNKYGKEVDPLVNKLHNLLNAGKNSPLFTDAEKEKMRKWMLGGGTLDELAKVYNDIFGSVAHSDLDGYLSHASDAFNRKRKDLPVSGMPTSAAAKAGFKGTTGTINNHISTAEKTASRRVYDPDTGEFKDSGTSITDKMIQNADRQQIINRATAMNNTTNKVLQSVQNNNQLGQLKELKSMIATYNQKYGAKLRLKEHSVVSAGWDNKLFTMEVTG